MTNDTKQCPYCGQTIKSVAKKCRFCGNWINEISDEATKTKKCPYCAEEIFATAVKCKYCGEMLSTKTSSSPKEVILEYINIVENNSQSILVYDQITKEKYTEYGVNIGDDEIPLIMLYKSGMFGYGDSKLLITDKKIYYKCFKDSFFTGIVGSLTGMNLGAFAIQGSERIEIGRHDICFGTAYCGHQLIKDDTVLGLVRMGNGVEYDDKAIAYINGLFEYLAEKNIIKYSPREYAWQ